MGFAHFSSPYDWSRIGKFRDTAQHAQGGMVDMSVGSPVDPVPSSVQQALQNNANAANAFGYPVTVGTAELQSAIRGWYEHYHHIDLDQINASIVPTVGSKEAVALMASLLHLGSEDVVVQPKISYPTYAIGTQLAGAQVHMVDDVADVDSWVNVPNVKAIWVNSPSNPTGDILSADDLRKIVCAARSINAVVLSDECYALLRWDGVASVATSMLDPYVCDNDAHNIMALYSLSKQSNMAGYRTAFVAGDTQLVKAMQTYRKQIGLIIPGAVQAAMVAGLEDTKAVQEQASMYKNRLEKIVKALQAYGYDAHMPQGALYVWVHALGADCWEDMDVLSRIGIIASPGEFYGASNYLRFSATVSDEIISQACERLEQFGARLQ